MVWLNPGIVQLSGLVQILWILSKNPIFSLFTWAEIHCLVLEPLVLCGIFSICVSLQNWTLIKALINYYFFCLRLHLSILSLFLKSDCPTLCLPDGKWMLNLALFDEEIPPELIYPENGSQLHRCLNRTTIRNPPWLQELKVLLPISHPLICGT